MRCRQSMYPVPITTQYGQEISGKHRYAFNSLGYRSEEFNPDAHFHIGVVGASNTLGIGLDYFDTYAYKFRMFIAAALGLDDGEICLANLSVAGGSNDYCARTILRQLPTYRPDLFIYDLAEVPRMELLEADGVRSIQLHGQDEASLAFLDLYTVETGAANLMRNVLIAQNALVSNNVPYIILNGTARLGDLEAVVASRGMYEAMDTTKMLQHDYIHLMHDESASCGHLGAASHTALAIELLDFYTNRIVVEESRKQQLAALSERLKQDSDDWQQVVGHLRVARIDPARLAPRGRITRSILRCVPHRIRQRMHAWCRRSGSSICSRLARF